MKTSFYAVILLASAALTTPANACDRNCLISAMDQYLGAVISHDPAKAPIAADARFTENGVTLPVGIASWNTIQALKDYRQYFADPVTGSVAYVGTVEENGQKAILSVRLRVKGAKITEAEHIVNRKESEAEKLNALAVNPLWEQIVPQKERSSRAKLIEIANSYFTSIEKGAGTPIPFADDCDRVENGIPTIRNPALDRPNAEIKIFSMGCREQLGQKGYFAFNTELRDRRFPLVDEERGVVFAPVFFDKAGNIDTLKLADGREIPTAQIMRRPWSMQMHEMFKIRSGKIQRIEATWIHNNFGQPSGWEGADNKAN